MCASVVQSSTIWLWLRRQSLIYSSTDRRIAPAVTKLYKRASQDVAQPMRLCSAPPAPPFSSLPSLKSAKQHQQWPTLLSNLLSCTNTKRHTPTHKGTQEWHTVVTFSLGLVMVDILCVCVGWLQGTSLIAVNSENKRMHSDIGHQDDSVDAFEERHRGTKHRGSVCRNEFMKMTMQ